MKIGIDIDNTITTTIPLLKQFCVIYNHEVVKRNLELHDDGFATYNFFDWTREEDMDFCKKHLEEVITNVKVKKDAGEVIKKLRREGNYICIITARKKPQLNDPYLLTKNYLDKNGIEYDQLLVGCEDKLSYCLDNCIDIMIDDEPQNITSISKKIPVIALEGIHNIKCKGPNIIKVDDWNEVYEKIQHIKEMNFYSSLSRALIYGERG